MTAPLAYVWTGEVMEPLRRFRAEADRLFVIGQSYTLAEALERSAASHAHYFAAVNEAWQNLPEAAGERFPTAEHLRKWALIKGGFHDERSIVCGSRAEAVRVAAFVKPLDDYAIVTVSQAVVTVYTAKSQSMKAMGKTDFQASKDAVLEIVAGLIEVTPAELGRAA